MGFAQTGTQDRSQDQDQDGWQFTVAPYLIFPWMDGKLAVRGREIDVDVSAGEIFDNLQFGAMGYFEARRGKWGVAVDVLYVALGTTLERLPANVDVDQGATTFMGLRRIHEKVDLVFGARWNFLTGKLEFKGPQNRIFEDTNHFVDPVIGILVRQPIGRGWHFAVNADIGGFGAGSTFAWHLFPRVGVDLGKSGRLGFGYRALGMDYTKGSGDNLFRYDVITSGPAVGFAIRF